MRKSFLFTTNCLKNIFGHSSKATNFGAKMTAYKALLAKNREKNMRKHSNPLTLTLVRPYINPCVGILIFLAARELLRIEKKSLAPVASNEPVSLAVGLLGVGPKFSLGSEKWI